MADVYCTNCGEPWDWWFLRDELVYETSLDEDVIENWDMKLTDQIRADFKEIGWVFGENLAHIIRCESCPEGETKQTLRTQLQSVMVDLLGDDIDGIIAEMEDAEWMFGNDLLDQ